jgi:hypothetical protein
MLTKPSLHFMGVVAVAFGSFVVIESVFGKVGMLLAIAIFIVYFLNTDASNTVATFFNWVSSLATE